MRKLLHRWTALFWALDDTFKTLSHYGRSAWLTHRALRLMDARAVSATLPNRTLLS